MAQCWPCFFELTALCGDADGDSGDSGACDWAHIGIAWPCSVEHRPSGKCVPGGGLLRFGGHGRLDKDDLNAAVPRCEVSSKITIARVCYDRFLHENTSPSPFINLATLIDLTSEYSSFNLQARLTWITQLIIHPIRTQMCADETIWVGLLWIVLFLINEHCRHKMACQHANGSLQGIKQESQRPLRHQSPQVLLTE